MRLRLATPVLGLVLAAAACGDDTSSASAGTETETDPTVSPTTGSMTASPSTSGGETTAATDVDESSSGVFDPPVADCGNGFVEGDEQCDDANNDNDDDCTNQCQFRCGLEWEETIIPPTGESQIDPRAVTRDLDDNVIVVGFLREVSTDEKGVETAEDDVVLAVSLGPDGAERWTQAVGENTGDLVVSAVAVDEVGDVFISATGNGPADDRDVFVYKLAGADGELMWTHTHDSVADEVTKDSGEDEAFGVSVGPDGNPVVAGSITVSENDDDLWLRKLDGTAGTELWTETWSGAGNEVFSIDNGGPVAVAPDGTIYVLGQEYVTFNTLPAVLFRFEVDGGPPTWTYSPFVEGSMQEYDPLDIGVDDDGFVYITFRHISGAVNTFAVEKIDPDQNQVWSLDQTAFENGAGEGRSIVGADPTANGQLVVAGQVTMVNADASWFEVWVSRLDADGSTICQVRQQGPQQSLLPSSLRTRAVGSAANGAPIIGAQLTEEADEALWVGRFLVN